MFSTELASLDLEFKKNKQNCSVKYVFQAYTQNDWNKVIFSDECRLEAVTESFQFVRRFPSERYSADCIQKRVKHPPSVMIWSCISAEGPGPIYFVDQTMNSDQYIKVLTDVVLPYMNSLNNSAREYTFMQDGAPCHTSKKSRKWLDENNIEILPWAGNSPDMNPIENCWSYLKTKVYARQNNTVKILKENIEDIWKNDVEIKQMIKNCINSMPARIKEVIKTKGNVTKY